MLMLDIWHRRIGSNWTRRRWKGNRALTADAPNLQRRVYDRRRSGCNWVQPDTSTLCAWGGHKMPCMAAPLCGECSLPISGQWAPLQLLRWPLYDAPRPAVMSACNPIPVVRSCFAVWSTLPQVSAQRCVWSPVRILWVWRDSNEPALAPLTVWLPLSPLLCSHTVPGTHQQRPAVSVATSQAF